MSVELPQRPEWVSRIKVFFYDTDAAGVVHNVAYLRLIEQARSELAEHLGWKLSEMKGEGDCPVVARTEIDYLKPARLGDTLEIQAQLSRLEKVRFWIDFVLRREGDTTVLVKARQMMVTVSLGTMRPRPLRREWIERWPELG
ncbi:MAG: acyl-CoA thioesterase [Blastochloris sp.]|nr:acyl-CoA thioesterase [Blastochloris sp.]